MDFGGIGLSNIVMNMKKYVLFGLMLSLTFIVSSWGNSLDIEKCGELIRGHSFMKLRHVDSFYEKLPAECESALAGVKEDGYAKRFKKGDGRDYYYYLYGVGIKNVRNLLIEEKRASCEFDLIEVDKTPAYEYKKDDRIGEEGVPCRATFICFEETGWQLDGIQCDERLLGINIWDGTGSRFVRFK